MIQHQDKVIIMAVFIVCMFLMFKNSFASTCPDLYPKGFTYTNTNTVELCNSFFVSEYDIKMKANIFSMEKVGANKTTVKRLDTFRPDYRLKSYQRAELSDYRGSGYDRGHMTPAGDASTSNEMYDTFLLSNMTPQNKTLNENAWKVMEMQVRNNITNTTFILTGAVYDKNPATIGLNKIPVPSGYVKCIWYTLGEPVCFKSINSTSAKVVKTTYIEVKNSLGIK